MVLLRTERFDELHTVFLNCWIARRSSVRKSAAAAESMTEAIEIEVNNRCGVERQHLAEDKASADGDTEWAAQL